jgi:hypothetical protein
MTTCNVTATPDTGGVSRGAALAQARRASSQLPLVRRPRCPVSQKASGVSFRVAAKRGLCRKRPCQASRPQKPASHFCCSLHEVR